MAFGPATSNCPKNVGRSPELTDPLGEVVGLLQPNASYSKLITASGRWRVRRSQAGQPFYCGVLKGALQLTAGEAAPIVLEKGDFILIPAAYEFETSSLKPPPRTVLSHPVEISPGIYRLGEEAAEADLRILIGHCAFGSNDAGLLVSLLPELVHVRGERRLTTLVELVNEEAHGKRPGRDIVLARLLEVLLIEALRSTAGPAAVPGLLRGLADDRLAVALRLMHGNPTRAWTVAELAKPAALSRSAFFDRFRREVGVPPKEYLLGSRMALAKDLLRREAGNVSEVAEQVGYSSASTFSVAFARHVGSPPTLYAREQRTIASLA